MTRTDLENELNNALEAQRSHILTMGQSFSQENMTIYTQLQERVRNAQAALRSTPVTDAGNTTATAQNAVVHLIRAGKASKVVEVPETATLRAVLDSVGWEPRDLNFQLRKDGASIDVTNIDNPVGEGTHEFLCNPKYAAGA